jgi:hypothetical protein
LTAQLRGWPVSGVALCSTLLAGFPDSAPGQATHDQARLAIGVGLVHASGGGRIWQVPDQPIISNTGTDTLALERRFTSGLGVGLSGIYFPNRYVGIGGEVVVVRIGSADHCRIIRSTGDVFTTALCSSLENAEHSSVSATFSGGVYLRPGFQGAIQPYGKLMLGFTDVEASFVGMAGYTQSGQTMPVVTLYQDEHTTTLSPYYAAGIGIAAGLGPGWQLRCEVRDTYIRLPGITGPTPRQGLEPRSHGHGFHQFNFAVSVDVVLERKRGRRY